MSIFSRALLMVLFLIPAAQAQDSKVYIDVGQAAVKKSLVALPPFLYFGSQATNASHLQAGQNLFQTVFNNLTASAFFTFIKQEAFLEDPKKTGLRPAPGDPNGFKFQSWSAIGTEFLIKGGYRVSGSKLSLEVYVYHVPQAKLVLGKTYEGTTSLTRKMAHTFSNDLIQALTGKPGMFLTQVAATRGDQATKHKEIVVMDWDGENAKLITNHKSLAISPSWSRDGKRIAYTAFAYHTKAKVRNADLFMYELDTEKRWLVSYRKGINSGAAFFPDGKEMLLTISQTGSPDIFRMTVDGKNLSRVTDGPNRAMNVEPVISPNGQQVAFSSDRHGRPMIYVMNIDGTGVRRVTFAGRYNASPSWSPDGKKIAFSGFDKSNFDIFVINVDGTGLKRLTDARRRNGKPADNEDPTFSPDGRLIMFSSNRSGDNKQLYVISPDGSNERRITTDRYSYEKPKWGPLL